jgi:FlaA1/EpsC-like NDP-sugar epimerase
MMLLTPRDRRRHSTERPVLPDWLLWYRGLLIWIFHMGMAVVSSYIAFSVRFDGTIPAYYAALFRNTLAALLVARGTMFIVFRLYEGLWRYTSVRDLLNILLSVGLSSIAFLLFIEQGIGLTYYPRSILVIDALLLTSLTGGVRLIARAHRDLVTGTGGRKVLIYGAGDAGEAVAREIRLRLSTDYDPIGFVDDDRTKVGARIHSIPVLGTRDDLPSIMKRYRPAEVLVTIPRADAATYRAVVRALEPFEVPIKTLPHLRDILDGRVSTSQIRDLSLEDLLRRSPVGLERQPLLGLIQGKTILVTGAGGSIGSELCRQIADLRPAALILYERHENSLYTVLNDLTARADATTVATHPIIGDVTDRNRLKAVLQQHRPDIVFHAAAHKHVPLMELNVCEAVKNNVLGTQTAAEVSEECGIERFILISSDKAVNPVSVMGATKRVAELMLQSRACRSKTTFVTVRFGNVLGSNGSVVPLFVEQLKRGGPLTVTHPDVRRYFMLIPEAVQLVLHAAAAGEANCIYVLEMGEPIRLLDLARDLIRLSGFKPDDVPITFIGLRPGEKLDEELVGRHETVYPSRVDSVMQVRPSEVLNAATLVPQIARLERLAVAGDTAGVLSQIRSIVPEFTSPAEWVRSAEPPVASPVARPAPVPVIASSQPDSQVIGGEFATAGTCAACGAASLHRSRVSGPIEQLRRQLSDRRPYRCYACGWRGWVTPPPFPPDARAAAIQAPDLNELDVVFRTTESAVTPGLIAESLPPLPTPVRHVG